MLALHASFLLCPSAQRLDSHISRFWFGTTKPIFGTIYITHVMARMEARESQQMNIIAIFKLSQPSNNLTYKINPLLHWHLL